MAEKLLVRFWMDAYKNEAKSQEAGIAIFDTVPWCEWRVPGEHDTNGGPVHVLAKEGPHRDPRIRFPDAWKAWQLDQQGEGMTGTPLSTVAWLEKGDVETLRYSGVKTVEQLASLGDGVLGNIPGAISLRQKAKDMLKAASDSAPIQRMSEELASRDREIASLKAQIAEILETKRGKRKPAEE